MPAVAQEARDQLGNAQTVGTARNLRRAADDLGRIADRIDLDDVIYVVALDLPRNARKRDQVVGDDDDAVGIYRIRQRKAQRAASRLAVRAIGVAEEVRRRRGNHRDVDMDFAILNRLPASAMRAQHAHAAHLAVRAEVAQRTVHAAFNVVDRSRLHQVDHRLVTRKRRAGEPHQVLDAHARAASAARSARRDRRCADGDGC